MRNEKIQIDRLNNAKAAIAEAIIAKGVEVPESTKLDSYPALINQISGSDIPNPPQDGKTRLYITIPANAMADRPQIKNEVPLYLKQTVPNGVIIDWGDESSTETLPDVGNIIFRHAYKNHGDFVITIELINGCELGLGHGLSNYCILGKGSGDERAYRSMLKRAYIGDGVTKIDVNAFASCYSLLIVVMSETITSIEQNAFHTCYSLSNVDMSKNITTIGKSAFQNCYSLTGISIPESATTIGENAFQNCGSLITVTTPKNVTNISSYAYAYCYVTREHHILSPTPPTLANNNAFAGVDSNCVIYVPKGTLNAYKSATNWASLTTYLQEEP